MSLGRSISKARLKVLIVDENKSSREYRRYGFKRLSRDERRHARFLKKKLGRS